MTDREWMIQKIRSLPKGQYDYTLAKQVSCEIDEYLKISDEPVDGNVHQTWAHLDRQIWMTPYTELLWMLNELGLAEGDTICDLGAGYGRLGILCDLFFSQIRCVGYECAPSRVEIAAKTYARLGIKMAIVILQDLSEAGFAPQRANAYFLYDFGTRQAISKTIQDLKQIARVQPISVVGRGRATRDQIELNEPWLSQVCAPKHLGPFSIYRSQSS